MRLRASRLVALCCFSMALLLSAIQLIAPAGARQPVPGPGTVRVLTWQGVINPAAAGFVNAGIDRAAASNAAAVVLQLDTPGGLDSSMRDIVKHILASPVPVITYVAPAGARAASAGTFILFASHIAAMAPGTNLGAASPVSLQVATPAGSPSPKAQEAPADNAATLAAKAQNDAAAYMRSLATLRGRNIQLALETVTQAKSFTAQEAMDQGAIDYLASTLPALVQAVHGHRVALAAGELATLDTRDASLVYESADWRTRLLDVIANPQLAVVLMMVGIYGLFFELTSPGFALPGVAGAICLLLALYAFHLLPVNWAGVGLAAVGALLMVAEIFVPSFGALGIGGIVAFMLGGLFLMTTSFPGYHLTLSFLTGVVVVFGALVVLMGWLYWRARSRPRLAGTEELIGLTGPVTAVMPDGAVYARIHSEQWRIFCNDALQVGDTVRVRGIDGLTLQVDSVAGHAPTAR